MKSLFFATVALLFAPCVLAQNSWTISGYVEDVTSGEKLIGANVYDVESGIGTATNAYGFYSLTIPEKDSLFLTVSYVGYKSKCIRLFLKKDQVLNLALSPIIELEEIEVKATSGDINDGGMDLFHLPVKQIRSLPALIGEPDVIKVLHLLPGVKFGVEGSVGFYVRGGSPDQNLILLDGVPIYNASHLFNFVSIFNPASISNIEFIKGGFPARYGGRLASVLDVRTKEGNMKAYGGEVTLGVVSSKFMFEGPIVKEKCSFVASARRSLYEVYTMAAMSKQKDRNNRDFTNLYFYDLNAKVNYIFSDADRVYLSYYHGWDKYLERSVFSVPEESIVGRTDNSISWGSSIFSLRWNHLWGNKLFSNFILYRNNYLFVIQINDFLEEKGISGVDKFEQTFSFNSRVLDYGGGGDFFYTPSSRHDIKFGVSAIRHRFIPGVKVRRNFFNGVQDPLSDTSDAIVIRTWEGRGYMEDNIQLSEDLMLNAGFHVSFFVVNGKWYHSLEPRLSMRFVLGDRVAWKASYSAMQQYIHLLTNSSVGLPTDLWVSPTENVPPQKADQIATEFVFYPEENYEISLGAYYKNMSGLIDYKEGITFLIEGRDWEKKVAVNGRGEAYGMELFFQKKIGKLTGWLGYTLSWVDRQFDEINEGRTYPFKYDRRHDVSLMGVYKMSPKVEFSFVWVFATGNAVWLPVSVYPSSLYPPNSNVFYSLPEVPDEGVSFIGFPRGVFFTRQPTDIFVYGDKNSSRMPNYHRLDVGVNFYKKKQKVESIWNLSVYNIYARRNPYFVRYVQRGGSVLDPFSSQGSFELVSLFQLIPSISYTLKF